MFKSIKKRFASFLAAVICISSILPLTSKILSADEAYNGGYDYASVLSQFQCFVEGDLTYSSHSVGALVAGGTANLDCFGEGSISASYFGHLASLTNFNSPAWVQNGGVDYLYFNSINDALYQKMLNWGRGSSFRSYPGYMDVAGAFVQLRSESESISNQAVNLITVDNIDEYGTLQVDLANGSNVKIDYAAFNQANVVSFIKTDDPDFGPATFAEDYYYISIVNVNGYINLDFYSKILVNGKNFSNENSLKSVLPSSNGGQIYLDGVNLVWNLPDATSVTASQLQGHLFAPNAHVDATGGNYEGGIIAASLSANAEGHFYPYHPNNVPLLSYSNKIYISKVDSNGDFLGGATLKITGKTASGDTIYDFNAATYDASTARSVTVEPDYIIWVSNGSAFTVGKLIEGTYTVEELDAPQGYYTVDSFTFTVNHDKSITFEDKANISFNADSNTFTVTDRDMPRTVVSLSKQDIDAKGREIPGASMKLTGVDTNGETIIFSERFVTPGADTTEFGYGEALTWTSGSTATSVALLDGTYVLSELVAPTLYDIVETNFTFTVASGKVVSSVTSPSYSLDGNKIAMFDELLPTPTPTTAVSISKKDIADGSELSGATLTITGKDADGASIIFTDDVVINKGTDAVVTVDYSVITIISGSTDTTLGLVDGSYTLSETYAPDGYNTITSVFTFTITDGVISSNVDSKFYSLNRDMIVVFNELKPTPTPTPTPTVEVTISKQDMANKGSELSGAELSLTGIDVENNQISFKDEDIILGKDATLMNSGDSLVWISGVSATKVNLVDGTYTLTEVYAPEGYIDVTTSFTFTVNNGVVTSTDNCETFTSTSNAVTLFNEVYVEPTPESTPVPTVSVSISKQDIDAKGTEIVGAELKLTGVDANGDTVIFDNDSIVLGNKAILNSTGSSLVWVSGTTATKVNLVDGTYTLTETVAPEDYEGTIVNTVFTFIVTDGVVNSSENSEYFTNDNNSVALFNALKPTPVPTIVVSISKQDIDNKGIELSGATLEITGTDVNGDAVTFDSSDVTLGTKAYLVDTDSDEVLRFVSGTTSTKINLVDGTYTLTEVYAPEHYDCVTTTFTFVITDGVVTTSEVSGFFTVNQKMIALYNALAPTEVSISKQDLDVKGTELSGATLELTGVDANGNTITIDEDAVVLGDNATLLSSGDSLTFVSGDSSTSITLPNGTYSLKETYSPNGYDKVNTVFSFTVFNGTISSKVDSVYYSLDDSSNTVVVFNNLSKTAVTISKQDLAGKGDELPGASMVLTGVDTNDNAVVFYDKNITVGKDAVVTSAKDSTILTWTSGLESMIVKLVDGTYTLKEDFAPEGYDIVTTEFTFVVENGVVKTSEVSDNFSVSDDVVVFFNELTKVEEPTPEITPEETPEITPEETPEITPEETPEVTPEETPEVTPEETPEITPEETPEVTPEETPEITPEETPEVTPEETPEVTPEETPVVTKEITPVITVVITPEPTVIVVNTTSVNLSKQDLAGNGDELPGATMSLTGVDSKGYILSFTADDVILPDDATLVAVGSKFVWTSGSKAAIINLPNGVYTLKEEVAPNGYDIVTTSFVFTVNDGLISSSSISDNYTINGNTIALFDALIADPTVDEPTATPTESPRPTFVEPSTITATPTPATVDITVVVVTEGDETPIEKAEVIVIDKDTNTIVTTFETDTEGSYLIENIPVGDYIVVQRTTREGYEIDESEHDVVVVNTELVSIDGIITTKLTIYNPTSVPEVTPNPTPAKDSPSAVTTNNSSTVTVTRTGETVSVTFILALVSFALAAFVLTAKSNKEEEDVKHI